MNALIKLFNIFIFVIIFNNHAFSEDKVKIGLVVPLSGEFEEIGLSIVNSIRLALIWLSKSSCMTRTSLRWTTAQYFQ